MKPFLMMACLACCAAGARSQNNVPVISGLSATVDTAQKKVTVSFDLADAENDSVEVSLAVSDNNGTTYFVNAAAVTGDVGFPVFPRNGRQIVWDYTAVTGNSGSYRIRVVADDRHHVPIQDMVDRVDSLRLIQDMHIVEGVRNATNGAAHLAEVKDTIFGRFTNLGLETRYQNFQYGSYQAQNIIGKKQGRTDEATVYIVDGHFDSVNGPGADDNGSAVIGVLEAARILSAYEFKKTIRFIGFDLEELGLLGSREYVNNGIAAQESVAGVLNFEMIGYYSQRKNSQVFPTGFNLLFPAAYAAVFSDTFRGNFITNVANTNSSLLKQKFDQCAAAYVPALRVISLEAPGNSEIAQDMRRSDHAPFWDKGYRALMLTDGAEYRNHNYHTSRDVSDSLSFGFIQNVVKATVATLAELAEPIHADMKTTDVQLPNVSLLGVQEYGKGRIDVSPNPGNESIRVGWTGTDYREITVTDMKGRLVYKSAIPPSANQHLLLTETYANGTYVVKLRGGRSELTQKIVVGH